jgi:predicted transcriptional regulator
MRTVQLTLDEELVAAVDKTAARLGTTRSGFTRQALRQALAQERERALERKHREGYARKPVRRGEFSAWEAEHAWGGRETRGSPIARSISTNCKRCRPAESAR